MAVDTEQRIVAFDEKPAHPRPLPGRPDRALASMGIYVFDTDFLFEQLERDARDATSSHDFGRDIIPRVLASARVFAHRFEDSCVNMVGDRPYWRDVGTLDAYWEANLDLTRVVPELNLYDESWPVLGRQSTRPPAKFVFDDAGRRGMAVDSLVSGGCIVSGATIRRSILFNGVLVAEGSLVEDSVVLSNVGIGRGVVLRRTIIDRRCVLPRLQGRRRPGARSCALPRHRARHLPRHPRPAGHALIALAVPAADTSPSAGPGLAGLEVDQATRRGLVDHTR